MVLKLAKMVESDIQSPKQRKPGTVSRSHIGNMWMAAIRGQGGGGKGGKPLD